MMKTTKLSVLPGCDVCKMEFPSSQPNPAKYDGPVSGGMWGYMCEDHKRIVPGLTIKLKVKS